MYITEIGEAILKILSFRVGLGISLLQKYDPHVMKSI